MDIWILVMLFLRSKLAYAANLYERRAADAALDLKSDVFTVCEKVISLNDMKRRIVNMKVLCDNLKDKLRAEDWALLNRYVGCGAGAIAVERGESRMRVFRSIKRALGKAARVLSGMGFDCLRMEEDYMDIPLCRQAYKKIKSAKSKSETDSAKIDRQAPFAAREDRQLSKSIAIPG